ncbi:MAG TPA: transcriptional regulator GlcC [Steroidobacteraceae bacterium]|nr:transcriptional regulator GlcC [Steroidobacteraceae bacterium]
MPFRNSTLAPHHSAADAVATKLEEMIADGVFVPDQALPSERKLCDVLGMSRPAVREGLRLLRGRGLLRTEHGRGSYIARLRDNVGSTPLLQLFANQPRTLFDLLEVRALLEGESARLAATRGTDSDFVRMARRYEELRETQSEQCNTDVDTHARLDHAFHQSICEASHNPVLVYTLGAITDLWLSSVFAVVANLYHRPPYKQQIDSQHSRLYQAVLARDPMRAKRAALDHLHSVRDSLRKIETGEERLVRSMRRLEY